MFSKARLDTLSDGIFGVAMTLLILDVRLPDDFHPQDGAELLQGLLELWPKFLPYVLSFGVLGLRWLANIEVRTRAEYVNREYVNWWLLYHLLITCVPFTTIVVGRFAHLAPAIWLYAGHTLSDRRGRPSSGPHHAASGAGRPSALPADVGDAADRLLAAGDCASFVDPRVALWALALNFAGPVIRRWSTRPAYRIEPAARLCRPSQWFARAAACPARRGIRMKNWLSFRAALALGLAASLLALAAPAHAEKRVALVIGNNDYKNVPKLQKAVNDARTMGDTLKQLGFSVMVAENQTRQAFSETLLAFDKAVEPGDTAFFFYAGHGFEIAGQNFLLPTDVPAATEGQEELVRDASVLADRVIERLQNKKVRTAILVFDACRNNPFERAGTRAVAGGGGLAPMTQLPEGVFSVFSAGPRQTALDRLSNNDDNPNSVFTRTFAKELLQPGENLVQVAQHTRRIVSEMAETVSHKQIPVYFDQMVDDVFLNGVAKGAGRGGQEAQNRPSRRSRSRRCRRCRCRAPRPRTTFRQRADRDVLPPQWRLDRGVLDRRSDARDFLADGRCRRIPRDRISRHARSAHPQADAQSLDRACRRRAGGDHPGPLCRHIRRIAGTVSDQIRSGGGADPRSAQDPRHDRDQLAVVSRVQRAAGLLHPSDVVSLRDPRGARRHRHARCRTRC